MIAILSGLFAVAAQAQPNSHASGPATIGNQAEQHSETPARIDPTSVPTTATGAPVSPPPLNTEIDDEQADRGTFIDTLNAVLDGRPPKQAATSTSETQSKTHRGQRTELGQRIARVTASLPWRILETLSLIFTLGIAAAAAYFFIRRGSVSSD